MRRGGHRRLESHKSRTGSDSGRVFQQQSASTSTRRWSAAAQKTSNLPVYLISIAALPAEEEKARIQVFVSPMAEAACAGMLSRSRARPLSPPPFGLLIRSELSLSPSPPPRQPGVDIVPRLPHSLTLSLRASLIFCYLRLPLFSNHRSRTKKRIKIIKSQVISTYSQSGCLKSNFQLGADGWDLRILFLPQCPNVRPPTA